MVIIVSLRTAASVDAPAPPMALFLRLQGKGGASERAGACQWALTSASSMTCWGSGIPEVGDLRLLEDGSECSDALVSNVVLSETASEGQDGIW